VLSISSFTFLTYKFHFLSNSKQLKNEKIYSVSHAIVAFNPASKREVKSIEAGNKVAAADDFSQQKLGKLF
jgi:hypothetical protein